MQNDLAVRQNLQREMEPGERLLWDGRPDPVRMMIPAVPMFLFGLFWTAGTGSFYFRGPTTTDWVFALFPIPFILVGLGMLASPLGAYLKGRRTYYAITDRQVLILTEGRTRKVQSFRERDITNIVRTERADGSGNLTFSQRQTRDSEGHTSTEDVALIGIPDVREVERVLRGAFGKGT